MQRQGRGRASSSSGEASTPTTGRGRGRGRRPISEVPAPGPAGQPIEQKALAKYESVNQVIRRPNYGVVGTPIALRTNFKLLGLSSNLRIYCYDVKVLKFNRDVVENRDICREVFWNVVSNNREIFSTPCSLVYDDCHILFSLSKLHASQPTLELQLWPEATPDFKPSHASYLVLISPSNIFNVTLDEHSIDFRRSMQMLDCLVTQRVRCPLMDVAKWFYPFGQSLYLKPYQGIPWDVLSMGPGMETWNGLYGAVKCCEKGLMLNVDVTTKVFYKIDMSILDFYVAVLNEFNKGMKIDNISKISENFAMSQHQRQRLKNALNGLILKLTYSDRHVKFLDVGQPARVQRFRLIRDGEFLGEATVEEYFHRYKNIPLQFPNLPVLHCGKKSRPEYYPMELLRLSDKPQRVKKRLTPFQFAKLIRGTALSPIARFDRIDWVLKNMGISTEDEFIQQYGIFFPSVNKGQIPESVQTPGRILPPTAIGFREMVSLATDGHWRLEDRFYQTPSNVLVAIVCVDRALEEHDIRRSLDTLIHACEMFGITFLENRTRNVLIYRWDTQNEDVDGHVLDFKKECNKVGMAGLRPLLIFIVPRKDDRIYGLIKVTCDKKEGVASQVIRAETLIKMSRNPAQNKVAHNICMKINTKLDGINNEVAKGQEFWAKFCDSKDATLFLGIDVTHPPSGDPSSPSIAAIVGSLNVDATRYGVCYKLQRPHQEEAVNIVDALRTSISEFLKCSGCKPQHIVVFRDGISDSQFMDVMNEELFCLKAAAYRLSPDYEPTYAYVVIQKRHHTRFVTEDERMSRGAGNIPPGTVVDSAITSPSLFDFYLCSHLGAIGTSRPAHYTVLFDSWHLTADEWQQMTYALCHISPRCNKTVSIPAPVYLAHLAAERAKYLYKYGREGAAAAAAPAAELNLHALERSFEINPDTPRMYFV